MLTRTIFLILIFTFSFFSCDKTKETKSGLEYQIVKDEEGETAEVGDMIIVNVKYENKKDTFSTYKRGGPINALLDSALMYPGSLEEGLMLLSPGDSAIFQVKNSVLYKDTFKEEVPKELKADERTTFYVKVDTIYKKEFIQAEQKKMIEQQMEMVKAYKSDLLDSTSVQQQIKDDEVLIQKYIADKGINATRTPNGVYVAVTDSGQGKVANAGDKVIVEYVGKLLTDKIFQTSEELGRPFDFVMGAGQAVLGWDEGMAGLKTGSKSIILIPSSLAYGTQGAPDPKTGTYVIPPDAPVVFEVEIKDIEKQK